MSRPLSRPEAEAARIRRETDELHALMRHIWDTANPDAPCPDTAQTLAEMDLAADLADEQGHVDRHEWRRRVARAGRRFL